MATNMNHDNFEPLVNTDLRDRALAVAQELRAITAQHGDVFERARGVFNELETEAYKFWQDLAALDVPMNEREEVSGTWREANGEFALYDALLPFGELDPDALGVEAWRVAARAETSTADAVLAAFDRVHANILAVAASMETP